MRNKARPFIFFFFCFTFLLLSFNEAYAPQFIAKGTTDEITLLPIDGAVYNSFDANGVNVVWFTGGYHVPVHNTFQLAKYDRTLGTATVYNNSALEGSGIWFDNDASYVYAGDRYGNFTRFNKATGVFTNYIDPLSSSADDAMSCAINAADGLVYGVNFDYHDALSVFRYNPTTEVFTEWAIAGYPAAATDAQAAFVHDNVLWFLAKNPGYVVAWNITTETAIGWWTVGYDLSYPTRYPDSMAFDEARHIIWLGEYGKGVLVKFDILEYEAYFYDVSAVGTPATGTSITSLGVIGNYVVWSNYANTWYIYNPDLGNPTDSSVWIIAQALGTAGVAIGTGNPKASPTDTIYVPEILAGSFRSVVAELTLDLTYVQPYATDIPTLLGWQFGSNAFIGGLIASLILMSVVMVPVMFVSRGLG